MMNREVLVIGSGPAGLSAANWLGQWQVDTLVVDEYPMAGGRLLGQLYRDGQNWWVGRQVAAQLLDDIQGKSSVKIEVGTSVTGLEVVEGGFKATLSNRKPDVMAKAVLVATGSAEIPIPLPGWTLPGVMTVGAAQVMANVYQVQPGRRGLIIGFGALAFAVAQELSWAGVDLAGIVLPMGYEYTEWAGSPIDQWRRLQGFLGMAPPWIRAMGWIFRHDTWLSHAMAWAPTKGIRAVGSRIRPNVAALEILGNSAVEGVRLTRLNAQGRAIGAPWVEPVDFVGLSGGLRPVSELADGARVAMHRSPGGVYDVPLFGPLGQTSRPGLYVAGNIVGIEGARIAMAQGELAALGLVRYVTGRADEWAREETRLRDGLFEARRQAPLVFDPEWALVHQMVADEWQKQRREGDFDAI